AAGTLEASDVAHVTAILEEIFEPDELAELRSILLDTVAIEDGDVEAMIRVAERLTVAFPPDPSNSENQIAGGTGGRLKEAVAAAAEAAANAAAQDLADDNSVEGGAELEELAEEVLSDPEIMES